MSTMRAAICTGYGRPERLEVRSVEAPTRAAGELLIQVHGSSINPVDWKILRGDLRIVFGLKPPSILGGDFSGVVLEAEPESRFKAGDKVWGLTDIRGLKKVTGAHCEVLRCRDEIVDHMPSNLSFIDAGVLPLVGLTAYQSLVHHASLQPGQSVLVNGCSGGVGLIAVQLAKALGAQVTGICSAANHDQAVAAGCDQVIDYRQRNPLDEPQAYDVWFDVVGNQNLGKVRHQLKDSGKYLNIVKLLSTSLSAVFNPLRRRSSHAVFVHPSAPDLEALRNLVEAGALRAVIETTYPLEAIAEAFERSQSQRVVGKLAIKIQ